MRSRRLLFLLTLHILYSCMPKGDKIIKSKIFVDSISCNVFDVPIRPMGINIDENGILYITQFDENGKNLVIRINEDDKIEYLNYTENGSKWEIFKSEKTLFLKPHAIMFDNEQNIYITEFGLKCILKFSKYGNFLGVTKSGLLHGPASSSISPQGNIYVSDYSSSKLVILNQKLDFIREESADFDRLHKVKWINDNEYYLVDTWNNRILHYKNNSIVGLIVQIEGNIIYSNNIEIQIKDSLFIPTSIDINNNNFFICNWGQNKVIILNKEFKQLKEIKCLNKPYDLIVNNNKLYITDSHSNRILICKINLFRELSNIENKYE